MPKKAKSKALLANTSNIIAVDFKGRRKVAKKSKALVTFLIPDNLPARIAAKIDKSLGPNGAWSWLGSHQQSNGYPQISWKDVLTGKRKCMNVHRITVCIREGRWLERTEYVLHKRGVPKNTVNPKHLRIGTQKENLADAKAEGRLRGKLSKGEVLKIANLYHKIGLDIWALAERFGVSNQSVSAIIYGHRHSELTQIPPRPKNARRVSQKERLARAKRTKARKQPFSKVLEMVSGA